MVREKQTFAQGTAERAEKNEQGVSGQIQIIPFMRRLWYFF